MEKSTIQQKVATTASILTNANRNFESSSRGIKEDQHRELVISINEMVERSLDTPLPLNECCIYRIPIYFLKLNEEAYTPRVISIGPFHNGCKRLEPMEKLKLRYFQRFRQRTGFNVETLVNTIKQNEERVRGCYAESIKLSSDDFVKLILVDGCFLIEVFYRLCLQEQISAILEDQILLNPISLHVVLSDLRLLENQLPFFVLDLLSSLPYAADVEPVHHSFTLLAIMVFEKIHDQKFPRNLGEQPIRHFVDLTKAFLLSSSSKLSMSPQKSNDLARSADDSYVVSQLCEGGVKLKLRSCKCLLDLTRHLRNLAGLARAFFLPQSRKPMQSDDSNDLASTIHLYPASQLYTAGVKFKVSASERLVQLTFTKGTSEIPRIQLDNNSETVYRNIIAFEQCHYRSDLHLTNYIVLLKVLINTPKDAELLISKGIIINYLANSSAVASLFHNLDTNILYCPMNSTYCDLSRDLNAFYNNTKHTWMAILKRDYFSTPWKIASTVAAATLLLLTLVQAICSIIQVVKM